MKGFGIIGVIAALLMGKDKFIQITPETPLPRMPADVYKPVNPVEPGTVYPGETFKPEQLTFLPKADVFKMPTGTPETGLTEPVAHVFAQPLAYTAPVNIPVVPQAVIEPVAIPDPIRTTTTRKTGWTWYTPGGIITSREPTPEEKESGLGCPEVPGIWTYPMESGRDLRYCTNQACPSNNWETMPNGERVAPTPAQLEDQGMDQPAGKRWFCRVCRTYQG